MLTEMKTALDKLEALGSTEAIVSHLEKEGIKGTPMPGGYNSKDCAVVNYVVKQLGQPLIDSALSSELTFVVKECGPNTQEFIKNFDASKYPQLIG